MEVASPKQMRKIKGDKQGSCSQSTKQKDTRNIVVRKGKNNNATVSSVKKTPGFSELVRRHQEVRKGRGNIDSQDSEIEFNLNSQNLASRNKPGPSAGENNKEDNELLDVDGMQYAVNPNEDQFDSEIDEEEFSDGAVDDEVSDEEDPGSPVKLHAVADNGDEKEEKIQFIESDPDVQDYIEKLAEKRVHKRLSEQEGKDLEQNQEINQQERTNKEMREQQTLIKSPSDTTLYTPVLKKGFRETNQVISKISDFVDSMRLNEEKKSETAHE